MNKPIIATLSTIAGAALGAAGVTSQSSKEIKKWHNMSDKHLALYLMMNQWVKVKQENKSIPEFLEKQGYKTIAIYGMNYVGETLLSELQGSAVTVKYAIDKNADSIYSDIELVTPDDTLDKVDAVIVTPITYFDEIEEQLSAKVDCPILSMEDILYEI